MLMYADDVAAASFTVQGLQKAINQVPSFWGLKVNADKSKIVVSPYRVNKL
jgi:hypothetical protein